MGRTTAAEPAIVDPASILDYLESEAARVAKLDDRLVHRRLARAAGRDILLQDRLEDVLARVFRPGYAVPKSYVAPRKKEVERIVNALISDTHFGANLDPHEVPLRYAGREERRRLGKVTAQIVDYKRQYRPKTRLAIHALGDLFQGQLHDPRDGHPLTLQFAAVLHYLVQLVFACAAEYPRVDFYGVPGNHGRNTARHPERGIHQKWDAIETMLYVALRTAVRQSKIPNVEIHIGQRPYYSFQAFDKKMFMTHGDTVLKPGYPGRSINVANLYQQICRWNGAPNVGGPWDLFAVGHVHSGSQTHMPGGQVMLTNGCLVPADPFALSIGSPAVACGQWIWESVPGHVCGDSRYVTVDDADTDPQYDRLIPEFPYDRL